MRGLALALLLSLPAQAQEWNSSCFFGLNDSDSAATLNDCESPDLLNVEANLQGTAILKRKGFSKSADLTITTAPVTGSHSFIDSSGNRLDIVCQDLRCLKSTNGNAFSAFLTTAAAGITRWSFVDQGGILYGANDRRDPIMRYDGTTRSSPVGMPLGSILELTQDRLAIGDISGEPNRIHFSSAGAYEQFTVGVNGEDSFFDDVGAAGDRIRGIRCIQGSCFVFKTASITLYDMGDQYTTQASVISPNIGTTDPASIVAAGSDLYFRAQDKNYWRIGRSGLEQISKKIPNLVKSQSGGLGGGENTNTQTTKADWDAGDQTPDSSWNTTTTNGSIFPSSFTVVDTSTTDFASGDMTSATTRYVSGDASVLGGILFTNTGFEDNPNVSPANITTNWTQTGTVSVNISSACGNSSAGTFVWGGANSERSVSCGPGISYSGTVRLINAADDSTLYERNISGSSAGGCDYFSFDVSTQPVNIKIRVINNLISGQIESPAFSTHSIVGGILQYGFGGISGGALCGGGNVATSLIFDMADPYYLASTTFTSRATDTGFTIPTWGVFKATATLPKGTTPYYFTESSADGITWDAPATFTTDGKGQSFGRRHIRYGVNFMTSIASNSASVQAMELTYATTGQFTTQCVEPNSSISAWGTLSCAQTLAGAGSLVYYATSAVSCAALPISTAPVNAQGAAQAGWTQQTNNATVTIATNTAVFIGWRSLLGSATDQAQVDACVLSWNEGTPAQPSWAAYDSRRQAIYWTSTVDGASATNRLLKYDLNLGEWFPWDIAAQAPRVINNELYFGGAGAGTWNKYGLVDSDNGSAINAYWKSKDIGSDPFKAKDFKTLSILSRNQGTGTMTGTWTNSIGNTGSYTISLSTGSGISYARSNFNLPKKSPQAFMNVRVGNNSSTPFEVLGVGLTWSVFPWKVEP